MVYRDRVDAGRRLAKELRHLAAEDPVVVALPRGGVPVGAVVAEALDAPLDVLVVRKLGCPGQPELGVGAIVEGGLQLRNVELIDRLGLEPQVVDAVADREAQTIRQQVARFRGGRPRVPVAGRTVIVVDDGLATGFTARAAIAALRGASAGRVVLAVPVAPADTIRELRTVADEVVCPSIPASFAGVGQAYVDFAQVSNEQVARLLDARRTGNHGRAAPTLTAEVAVSGGARVRLPGLLAVPAGASAIVVFAHGSGSSRHSPRNQAVARALQTAGYATLLFDLLTTEEAADRANVFDVDLLARRLVAACRWLAAQPDTAALRPGLFGSSTGAAAALVAAAQLGPQVGAVVSRGGRPDLAGVSLAAVTAPTLLIVGSEDREVLRLNRQGQQLLRCHNRLETVPGATHLFEEPGALETVVGLAEAWFHHHLRAGPGAAPPADGRPAGQTVST